MKPPNKKRNTRRWYEDGDLAILDKHGTTPTLVEIRGMCGDNSDGEVIYTVVEVVGKLCYPTSDKHLRYAKGREEVDALCGVSRPSSSTAERTV